MICRRLAHRLRRIQMRKQLSGLFFEAPGAHPHFSCTVPQVERMQPLGGWISNFCGRPAGLVQALGILTLEHSRTDRPPPEKITGDGRGSSARHSSGLRFQFFRVEVFSLLPKSQRNGRYLACQRQTRHGWLDQGNPAWLRGPKRKSAKRQK